MQTILEEFRAHPDQATYGFAPPDGHPQCFCERCQQAIPRFGGKGFGEPSLSDSWFAFANAVAKEVYKEFPDRWLFTNGYANRYPHAGSNRDARTDPTSASSSAP